MSVNNIVLNIKESPELFFSDSTFDNCPKVSKDLIRIASFRVFQKKISESSLAATKAGWMALDGIFYRLRSKGLLDPCFKMDIISDVLPFFKASYKRAHSSHMDCSLRLRALTALSFSHDGYAPSEIQSCFGIRSIERYLDRNEIYQIYDDNGTFAIFKPSLKKTMSIDEGDVLFPHFITSSEHLAEVAAYEIAKHLGSVIPKTVELTAWVPRYDDSPWYVFKTGSLQEYFPELIRNTDHVQNVVESCEDETALTFESFYERESVELMTLLDLIIGNSNRSDLAFMVDPVTKKVKGLSNAYTFPQGLVRLDGSFFCEIASHFALQPDDGQPLLDEVKEKILSLSFPDIARDLVERNLINTRQAAELIIRAEILKHILSSSSTVSLRKISAPFMPLSEKDQPFLLGICQCAYDKIEPDLNRLASEEEKLDLYVSTVIDQAKMMLQKEIIESFE